MEVISEETSTEAEKVEVRFHGRGGMGAVLASQILAQAAFQEGRWVQSFPFFGVERRGAPVTAFTRIASERVEVRTNVYTPDLVVVLDPSLLKGDKFLAGLRDGGTVVANGADVELPWSGPTYLVDATSIALDEGLGSRSVPIVNTAMAGALTGATDIVSLDSVIKAIRVLVTRKTDANVRAAERAAREVREVAA